MTSGEFVGVPRDDWRDLTDRVGRLASVLAILLFAVLALILALVRKDVLSFSDLLPVPGG